LNKGGTIRNLSRGKGSPKMGDDMSKMKNRQEEDSEIWAATMRKEN